MDLRTGRTYETKEAALAAGVPESDIAEVHVTRDYDFHLKFANPKYSGPHQGKRETERRRRRMEEQQRA